MSYTSYIDNRCHDSAG